MEHALSDAETAIDNAEQAISTLKEEIAALEGGIKALDKSVMEATEQRKQEHKEFNDLMASNTAAKEPLMSVTFHIFCVLLVPGALASWSSSRSLHAFGSSAFYHPQHSLLPGPVIL